MNILEAVEEQLILEGVRLGIQKGQRALLLHQLRLRFGNQIDTALEGEIHTASRDELIEWSDRILSATTLDELTGGQPMTYGLRLRRQGELRGIQKGQCRLLVRQLRCRFGDWAVDDAIERRLEAASSEQLAVWSERILSVGTLTEVLAD